MNGTNITLGLIAGAAIIAHRNQGSSNYDLADLAELIEEEFANWPNRNLAGWRPALTPDGGLYWTAGELDPEQTVVLLADPPHDGRGQTSVELVDHHGKLYPWFSHDLSVAWPEPSTAEGDIAAYLNAIQPTLQGLAGLLQSQADLHPFKWNEKINETVYGAGTTTTLLQTLSTVPDRKAQKFILRLLLEHELIKRRPILGGRRIWPPAWRQLIVELEEQDLHLP